MRDLTIRHVCFGSGRPKICVPIAAETRDELKAFAGRAASAAADLFEWRCDWLTGFSAEDLGEILKELRQIIGDRPLIFTFRTGAEGGRQDIGEAAYLALLKAAAKSRQADLIDIEYRRGDALFREAAACAHEAGAFVIASYHDFSATPAPEEMLSIFGEMHALGADFLKLAVMPQGPEDVLRLMAATRKAADLYDQPVISMSMGGMGVFSRVSGELTGSAITFASAGRGSAPGQMDAADVKTILTSLHDASFL